MKATWRLEGARSEYEKFLLEQRDYRAIEKCLVPEAPPGARRRGGLGTLLYLCRGRRYGEQSHRRRGRVERDSDSYCVTDGNGAEVATSDGERRRRNNNPE